MPPYQIPFSKSQKSRSWPKLFFIYLLKEQRLIFVVVGMLIAASFFILHPNLSKIGTIDSCNPVYSIHTVNRQEVYGYGENRGVIARNKRVPVGLKQQAKRIVVTGGAGFVGSHLVDKLLERGDTVIVVDNFFTGRKENVVHHFGNPRFELIRHDVVEPILLEVDQIYHLACPTSPVHYKYNPIKTIKTNVMGTLNMLGLAKRIGARFLLTSTSEVYGDPLEHPQKESYWGHVNPIGRWIDSVDGKRTHWSFQFGQPW